MWTNLGDFWSQSEVIVFRIIPSGLSAQTKANKVELLPLVDDLEQLKKIVLSKKSSIADVLEQQPQQEAWSDLAQATLARLVMLNKRRGGEASKMLPERFVETPDWTQVNSPEILSSPSGFERELSKTKWEVDGLDCGIVYFCL